MEELKDQLYDKLNFIQSELKAPKSNYNSFGNYNYRSCEDILEAVKPLCKKYRALLTLTDDIVVIADRVYVKAKAILRDLDDYNIAIEVQAFAREPLEKKGMDSSQVTGTASSYARKYALNGLFNIDDTKDADTNEYQKQTKDENNKQQKKTTKNVDKLKANITDIEKPMNFGKYKEKTWIEVYAEDKAYLENLVNNCKSDEGKKVYSNLIKQVSDSFISVSDEEIENIFDMNGDVINE